ISPNKHFPESRVTVCSENIPKYSTSQGTNFPVCLCHYLHLKEVNCRFTLEDHLKLSINEHWHRFVLDNKPVRLESGYNVNYYDDYGSPFSVNLFFTSALEFC